MATAYVYSPVDGIITGRGNYCGIPCDNNPCTGDHGVHGTCKGWSSPVDVDAQDNESVVLYMNTAVQSIITWIQNVCCCTCGRAGYCRAIVVDLYGEPNGHCYIGSVLYGHVGNPQVVNGQLYNSGLNGKQLGTAPAGDGTCACYSGSHSHMERSGGATDAPCCCTDTVKGSTRIYHWDFTIPCPSGPQPQ